MDNDDSPVNPLLSLGTIDIRVRLRIGTLDRHRPAVVLW